MSSDAAFVKLATTAELPPGSLIDVEHEGVSFALCNVDGNIRAIAGECPHEGGPLGQGGLEGPLVTCPWHCWQFDSLTGVCVQGDDVVVETYAVRVEGGDVLVQIGAPRIF